MLSLPSDAIKWVKLHRTHLKGDIEKAYREDIEKDFREILPHLPENVGTILDIGCGMAGIDILLAWHYPFADITLLDGDGSEKNARGGFQDTMAPFNDRKTVEKMFQMNGVVKPTWKEVGTGEVLRYDLVISLLSCGFHYPVETYDTHGVHIMDIRQGQPVKGTVISSDLKKNRCVWWQ